MEKQTKSTRFCLICNYVSRYVHRLLICWFITDSGTLFLGHSCPKKKTNVNIVISVSTKHLREFLNTCFIVSRGISDCIGILKWRKGKPKYLKKGSCKQWDCKRSSMAGKPFHLIRNVSGISNQKFCLNGKCPWCQVWELPQKVSSSRLVQNGSTWVQNWSCWPSHQTNWTCCGPVLPLVQTCILFFFLDACECHTLPLPKTSQAQIWNQNIHSCQSPAGICDLLSALLSCWFSSSLGHPTWYFSQP